MPQQKTTDDLFREKPYLFWGISPHAKLSDESKVLHILNYGDMDDIEILLQELGTKKVYEIFNEQMNHRRKKANYYKELLPFLHYFLYKKAYVA